MKLKELINQRQGLVAKIEALVNAAEAESRDFTDEEKSEYDDLGSQVRAVDAKISRAREVENMRQDQERHDAYLNEIPGPRADGDPSGQGLSQQDQRDLGRYSFVRAIRAQVSGQRLDGVEAEMHQEACREAQASGTAVEGLGIPQAVLQGSRMRAGAGRGGASRFRSDLTAETATEGAETIQTNVGSLIDILHDNLLVRQMGATMLSGLVGNISFPRAAAGTDPAHKAENAAADETSPTFDTVTLSPERLPVYIEVSHQLLRQSSIGVEQWIRNYLATRIAVIMDKMAINGSGSSNQPEGILNTSGIGSVLANATVGAGAVPVYGDAVDLETEVAVDNADIGSLGYVTTPGIRGVLRKTEEFSGTTGRPVWMGSRENGEVNGYPARASNVVPSDLTEASATGLHALIFGNWQDLVLGQWGGLDIMANPYSLDTTGLVRINAAIYYDAVVLRPQSFAAVKDCTLS